MIAPNPTPEFAGGNASPAVATDNGTAGRHRCGRSGSARVGPLRIGLIALGFLIFWPIGLALLVWTLWHRQILEWPAVQRLSERRAEARSRWNARRQGAPFTRTGSVDNTALSAYLQREQDRLAAEQRQLDELVRAFEAFRDAERRSADERSFEEFLKQHDDSQSASQERSDAPAGTTTPNASDNDTSAPR